MIGNEESAIAAIGALQRADPPVVAFDLEHHSAHSLRGYTCVLQASTKQEDFVFDTADEGVRRALRAHLGAVLQAPLPLKVFHGAVSDVTWLATDFGVRIGPSFVDTHECAVELGWKERSLQGLVRRLLGVEMDKGEQCGDWRRRPMTESMLSYARGDTRWLLPMAMRVLGVLTGVFSLEEMATSEPSVEEEEDEEDEQLDVPDAEEEAAACLDAPEPPPREASFSHSETLLNALRRSLAIASKTVRSISRESKAPNLRSLARALMTRCAEGVLLERKDDPLFAARAVWSHLVRNPMLLVVCYELQFWREELSEELDERFAEWALNDSRIAALALSACDAWALDRSPESVTDSPFLPWLRLSDAALETREFVAAPSLGRQLFERRSPGCVEVVSEWKQQWWNLGWVSMPDLVEEALSRAFGTLERLHRAVHAADKAAPIEERVQSACYVALHSTGRVVFQTMKDAVVSWLNKVSTARVDESLLSSSLRVPFGETVEELPIETIVAPAAAKAPMRKKSKPRREWRVRVLDAKDEFVEFVTVAEGHKYVRSGHWEWLKSPAEAEADASDPTATVEVVARHILSDADAELEVDPFCVDGFREGVCCGCGVHPRGLAQVHIVPGSLYYLLGPQVAGSHRHDRAPLCSACAKVFRRARNAEYRQVLREMGVFDSPADMQAAVDALCTDEDPMAIAARALVQADAEFDAFVASTFKKKGKSRRKAKLLAFAGDDNDHDDEEGEDRATATAERTAWDLERVVASLAPGREEEVLDAAEALVAPSVTASCRSVRMQRCFNAGKRLGPKGGVRVQVGYIWMGPRPSVVRAEACDEYDWLTRCGPCELRVAQEKGLASATPERGFDRAALDDEHAARSATTVFGSPEQVLNDVPFSWDEACADELWFDKDGGARDGWVPPLERAVDLQANVRRAARPALEVLRSSSESLLRLGGLRRFLSNVSKLQWLETPEAMAVTSTEKEFQREKLARQLRLQRQPLLSPESRTLERVPSSELPDRAGPKADDLAQRVTRELFDCQRGVLAAVAGASGSSLQGPLTQALPFGAERRVAELLRFGPGLATGLELRSSWLAEERSHTESEVEAGPSGLSVAAERRVEALVRRFRKVFLESVTPSHLPDLWSVHYRVCIPRKQWGHCLWLASARGDEPFDFNE
jgi:exosome complex exonuclease RRP6